MVTLPDNLLTLVAVAESKKPSINAIYTNP